MNLFFLAPTFFSVWVWKIWYCLHKIENIYHWSLKFPDKHRNGTKIIENLNFQTFRSWCGANDSFCVLGNICILIIQIWPCPTKNTMIYYYETISGEKSNLSSKCGAEESFKKKVHKFNISWILWFTGSKLSLTSHEGCYGISYIIAIDHNIMTWEHLEQMNHFYFKKYGINLTHFNKYPICGLSWHCDSLAPNWLKIVYNGCFDLL